MSKAVSRPRAAAVSASPPAPSEPPLAILPPLNAAALDQLWKMERAIGRTRAASAGEYAVEVLQDRARFHRIYNLTARAAPPAATPLRVHTPPVTHAAPAAALAMIDGREITAAQRLEQAAIELRSQVDALRRRIATWPPKLAMPPELADQAEASGVALQRSDGTPIEVRGHTPADRARQEMALRVQELTAQAAARRQEQQAAQAADPARHQEAVA